jgi:hypothetical protein
MAAPTATTRQDPSGIMMENGYRSLVTVGADPDCSYWEIGITPIGIDGGDAIDTTTMHNDDVRTKAPRTLHDYTDGEIRVGYDPNLLALLQALVNEETTITIRFYDGTTWAFYGYVRVFDPDEMVEGELPEATITITPTNWDYVNNVEARPVVTNVAGT